MISPEIIKANDSVIGTLGNFSASIGKAKSKKTFNVSTIVTAALMNGTVLRYTASLPENKRDENARGHIGTELNNKAETVLLVEKDSQNHDISCVKSVHIRAMDFEPFAFRINSEALPELLDGYVIGNREGGKCHGLPGIKATKIFLTAKYCVLNNH